MYAMKKDYHIEKQFSQKKLFALGTFDSINSILGSYATPYLSVLLMTILDKLSLPLTMAASFCYLKTRYSKVHYLGAFITIYGVCVAFIPDFSEGGQVKQDYWLVLYIISLLPAVASFCYKEHHLKDSDLDIWWMNGWISVWQIIFGLLTFPVILAPLPSGDNVHPDTMGDYLVNATICQFQSKSPQATDNCDDAFLIFFLYQVISTLCNILMFMIIRMESSVVYIIINTLKMPITAWLGSYSSLVGDQAQSLNIADFFSFIGIAIGVVMYNWEEESNTRKRSWSKELSSPLTGTVEL
jgi:hypothetical protein